MERYKVNRLNFKNNDGTISENILCVEDNYLKDIFRMDKIQDVNTIIENLHSQQSIRQRIRNGVRMIMDLKKLLFEYILPVIIIEAFIILQIVIIAVITGTI